MCLHFTSQVTGREKIMSLTSCAVYQIEYFSEWLVIEVNFFLKWVTYEIIFGLKNNNNFKSFKCV